MTKKWIGLGALLTGLMALSACSNYQGWTRYDCQLYENWEKPECNPPQCKALGVCTEDIFKGIEEVEASTKTNK